MSYYGEVRFIDKNCENTVDAEDENNHSGVKNLKPFKSGEEWTGNAKGRPKGSRNRSTIVRELLEVKATDGEGGQVADQLVRSLIKKAAAGDVAAFKELFDSGYGKNTDKVESNVRYTQMGRVTIGSGEEAKELIFDVGSPPNSA